MSDFLSAADGRKVTLLELLNMSAPAFDCVDHSIIHAILLLQLNIRFVLTNDVIK